MSPRERLPNKRVSRVLDAAWRQLEFTVTVGFDTKGRAREVFYSGGKPGSGFAGLMEDACILFSRLLQMGVPAAALAQTLTAGDKADVDGLAPETASPLGHIARHIEDIEAQEGPGIARGHGLLAAKAGM